MPDLLFEAYAKRDFEFKHNLNLKKILVKSN